MSFSSTLTSGFLKNQPTPRISAEEFQDILQDPELLITAFDGADGFLTPESAEFIRRNAQTPGYREKVDFFRQKVSPEGRLSLLAARQFFHTFLSLCLAEKAGKGKFEPLLSTALERVKKPQSTLKKTPNSDIVAPKIPIGPDETAPALLTYLSNASEMRDLTTQFSPGEQDNKTAGAAFFFLKLQEDLQRAAGALAIMEAQTNIPPDAKLRISPGRMTVTMPRKENPGSARLESPKNLENIKEKSSKNDENPWPRDLSPEEKRQFQKGIQDRVQKAEAPQQKQKQQPQKKEGSMFLFAGKASKYGALATVGGIIGGVAWLSAPVKAFF